MLVNRRGAHCLPLSPSLELRYSISAVADSKGRYASGYYNSARFYLYSRALKKMVGREWLHTYKFTKKEIAKAKGAKPVISDLSDAEIQMAFATLLDLNQNLPSDYKKTKASARIHLNENVKNTNLASYTAPISIPTLLKTQESYGIVKLRCGFLPLCRCPNHLAGAQELQLLCAAVFLFAA